eukprot:3720348-Prymnesium_polylepis.1
MKLVSIIMRNDACNARDWARARDEDLTIPACLCGVAYAADCCTATEGGSLAAYVESQVLTVTRPSELLMLRLRAARERSESPQ